MWAGNPSFLTFIVCVLSTMVASDTADGLVKQNADVAQPNGRILHVSRTSDPDCLFREDTTFAHGVSSTVFKDFQAGKSALLLSNSPDVCFIREISKGEQMSQANECRNGEVLGRPGESAFAGRSYKEGGILNVDDLSRDLAEFCGDRRIVSLVAAVPLQPLRRGAADCTISSAVECEPVDINCRDQCVKYGWFWNRRKCRRSERRCDKGERCQTIKKTTC